MKWSICLLVLFCVKNTTAQINTLSSSNLPIIVINTQGNTVMNEPKVDATMGIIYNAAGTRNQFTDAFNDYNGNIGIEYRGQSSQSFPMKSYGIELRDDTNESQEKPLLGMPKESDWVLYAPYTDKTLMRNVLAYTLSRKLGHWAARCRYVELVVNDDYMGIYVLMEKIKRGSNRVNISKIGSNDNSGDAVTGGYIISIDKDPAAFTSRFLPPNAAGAEIRFSNVYPKPDKISVQQNAYIKSYIDSFETALDGNDFQNPQTGVRKYADLASFTDYFLLNELSHNVDGYRLSTFLYKDKTSLGGKLTIGPVWDYDLAFRNADYCSGSNTDTWAWQFNSSCPGDFWQVPFWWNKLAQDTAFMGALTCRYKAVRASNFSAAALNTTIDSIADLLKEAQLRHFIRWPVLGQYVWPNPQPIPISYEGEISTLKTWLSERLNWLDNNIDAPGYCSVAPTNENLFVTVAPNPVSGQAIIRISSNTRQKLSCVLYSASGQIVYLAVVEANPGSNQILNVPFKNLPAGVYLFKATAANGNTTSTKILSIH